MAEGAAPGPVAGGGSPDPFDEGYFDRGVLRRSRALTHSAYRGIVLDWLRRVAPDALAGGGTRALEIGCGFGYASELLARCGYAVTATDISEFAVREAEAEQRDEQVEFRVWDATTPAPFPGGFALIAAFEVIEHLPDPEAAIASWRELLAPGGVLVLTTPNRLGPLSRHRSDPTHCSVRSAAGWRRALAATGPWAETRVSTLQWVPYSWKLDGVMRVVPAPLLGAQLRLLARRPR